MILMITSGLLVYRKFKRKKNSWHDDVEMQPIDIQKSYLPHNFLLGMEKLR